MFEWPSGAFMRRGDTQARTAAMARSDGTSADSTEPATSGVDDDEPPTDVFPAIDVESSTGSIRLPFDSDFDRSVRESSFRADDPPADRDIAAIDADDWWDDEAYFDDEMVDGSWRAVDEVDDGTGWTDSTGARHYRGRSVAAEFELSTDGAGGWAAARGGADRSATSPDDGQWTPVPALWSDASEADAGQRVPGGAGEQGGSHDGAASSTAPTTTGSRQSTTGDIVLPPWIDASESLCDARDETSPEAEESEFGRDAAREPSSRRTDPAAAQPADIGPTASSELWPSWMRSNELPSVGTGADAPPDGESEPSDQVAIGTSEPPNAVQPVQDRDGSVSELDGTSDRQVIVGEVSPPGTDVLPVDLDTVSGPAVRSPDSGNSDSSPASALDAISDRQVTVGEMPTASTDTLPVDLDTVSGPAVRSPDAGSSDSSPASALDGISDRQVTVGEVSTSSTDVLPVDLDTVSGPAVRSPDAGSSDSPLPSALDVASDRQVTVDGVSTPSVDASTDPDRVSGSAVQPPNSGSSDSSSVSALDGISDRQVTVGEVPTASADALPVDPDRVSGSAVRPSDSGDPDSSPVSALEVTSDPQVTVDGAPTASIDVLPVDPDTVSGQVARPSDSGSSDSSSVSALDATADPQTTAAEPKALRVDASPVDPDAVRGSAWPDDDSAILTSEPTHEAVVLGGATPPGEVTSADEMTPADGFTLSRSPDLDGEKPSLEVRRMSEPAPEFVSQADSDLAPADKISARDMENLASATPAVDPEESAPVRTATAAIPPPDDSDTETENASTPSRASENTPPSEDGRQVSDRHAHGRDLHDRDLPFEASESDDVPASGAEEGTELSSSDVAASQTDASPPTDAPAFSNDVASLESVALSNADEALPRSAAEVPVSRTGLSAAMHAGVEVEEAELPRSEAESPSLVGEQVLPGSEDVGESVTSRGEEDSSSRQVSEGTSSPDDGSPSHESEPGRGGDSSSISDDESVPLSNVSVATPSDAGGVPSREVESRDDDEPIGTVEESVRGRDGGDRVALDDGDERWRDKESQWAGESPEDGESRRAGESSGDGAPQSDDGTPDDGESRWDGAAGASAPGSNGESRWNGGSGDGESRSSGEPSDDVDSRWDHGPSSDGEPSGREPLWSQEDSESRHELTDFAPWSENGRPADTDDSEHVEYSSASSGFDHDQRSGRDRDEISPWWSDDGSIPPSTDSDASFFDKQAAWAASDAPAGSVDSADDSADRAEPRVDLPPVQLFPMLDPPLSDAAGESEHSGRWEQWLEQYPRAERTVPEPVQAQVRPLRSTQVVEEDEDVPDEPVRVPSIVDRTGGNPGLGLRRPRNASASDSGGGQNRMVGALVGVGIVVALVAVVIIAMSGSDNQKRPTAAVPSRVAPSVQSPPSKSGEPAVIATPGCEQRRTPDIVSGTDPGGTTDGPSAILAFERAYYVQRSGFAARAVVAEDSAVPPAEQIQRGINQIPLGTLYCVEITRTEAAAGEPQWRVKLTQQMPGSQATTFTQLITTVTSANRTLITTIAAG
ncbi:hypothetical protein [Nocardia bovistercoris]|uniref:DUF8176 domain-containing protein n=1 Tax=Nocardia bovistercoris TaxID=2785916 RepID=A0A931IC25_9NOCA|nr:hypothetical protein [Nocardia bovistercoris]MBH0777063.1 hypothetical protein [Nocardia bovistercoris]